MKHQLLSVCTFKWQWSRMMTPLSWKDESINHPGLPGCLWASQTSEDYVMSVCKARMSMTKLKKTTCSKINSIETKLYHWSICKKMCAVTSDSLCVRVKSTGSFRIWGELVFTTLFPTFLFHFQIVPHRANLNGLDMSQMLWEKSARGLRWEICAKAKPSLNMCEVWSPHESRSLCL